MKNKQYDVGASCNHTATIRDDLAMLGMCFACRDGVQMATTEPSSNNFFPWTHEEALVSKVHRSFGLLKHGPKPFV
jgi:hypothetical protein